MTELDRSIAISARSLGKQYLIGGPEQLHGSFREMVRGALRNPFKRFKNLAGHAQTEEQLFWALKDLDFDIPQGQITGVVGRNGAGKSTLLKLLSRITTPTTGEIKIRGRVASLLEVGSGFHPELTGRENIYMNASILGMPRHEVHQKLEEIVEFAEVGRFLDTPVKRYSSGMYVRLAFSVAAHVDPDVLFVDEVLAVGDAKFQQKCVGKLSQVSQQGRTVLFVSHNMGLVQDLCSHTIYLKNGSIEQYGETDEVLSVYVKDGSDFKGGWKTDSDSSVLQEFRLVDKVGEQIIATNYDSSFWAEIKLQPDRKDEDYVVSLLVSDELGRDLLTSWDSDSLERVSNENETLTLNCELPSHLFRPGNYFIKVVLRLTKHRYLEKLEEVSLPIEISNVGCKVGAERYGIIAPVFKWQVKS